MFNKYKKRRIHNTVNLLTGQADVAPGEQEVGWYCCHCVRPRVIVSFTCSQVSQKSQAIVPEIISYFHPNVTISIVYDQNQYTPGGVPEPLNKCKDGRSLGPLIYLFVKSTFHNTVSILRTAGDIIIIVLFCLSFRY